MQYLSNRSTELQMWAENIAIAIRPALHEWGGRLLDLHDGQLASLREKQFLFDIEMRLHGIKFK